MTTVASQITSHAFFLLNNLFRCRWKKPSKLRVTGLCARNPPGPVNSLHKGPVLRKMFPFDDVTMRNDAGLPTRRTHLVAVVENIILLSQRKYYIRIYSFWLPGTNDWLGQVSGNLCRSRSKQELNRFILRGIHTTPVYHKISLSDLNRPWDGPWYMHCTQSGSLLWSQMAYNLPMHGQQLLQCWLLSICCCVL